MSDPGTLDELRRRAEAGETFDFLFFWGHRPARDGSITAACLSQWFASPFEVGGVRYATAEHFMMAGKARLFGDATALRRILDAPTPGEAKTLGRKVAGFDAGAWAAERSRIVVEGNLAKFGQNPRLRAFLAGTAGRVLVEASPADAIWGIGLAASDPAAANPALWPGLNLLGFALMEVRDRL
ncbi:MAG: NADAR family protein [Thermoleophilia bacterium]|nr:NADAR family protein [Thermoleophilia bacterium]